MGIRRTSTVSQAALNSVVLLTSLLKKSKALSWTPDSSHLNHSAWHAADILLRELFREWQSSSGKCDFTRFLYLCLALTCFTIFPQYMQKCPGAIPFFFFPLWQASNLCIHKTQCFPLFVPCWFWMCPPLISVCVNLTHPGRDISRNLP